MKIKGFLALLIIFTWGCVHSLEQEAGEKNPKKHSYSGKVKSVEKMKFEVMFNNGEVIKGEYEGGWVHFYDKRGLEIKNFRKLSNGEQKSLQESFYDTEGKLIKEVYSKGHYNNIIANSFSEAQFDYWPSGQKLEEQRFAEDGSLISRSLFNVDGTLSEYFLYDEPTPYHVEYHYNYKYDEFGRIVEKEFAHGRSKEYSFLEYDSTGHKELTTVIAPNGEPLRQELKLFDKKGNELGVMPIFDHALDENIQSYVREYNDNNNYTRIRLFSNDKVLLDETRFFYDDNLNIMRKEISSRKQDGSFDFKEIEFENKYDRNNNLIQQIRFDNGEPVEFTQWKIKYYFP